MIKAINCFLIFSASLSSISIAAGKSVIERKTINNHSHICVSSTTPNDTSFGSTWAHDNIHSPEAWDISLGSKDVSVAVIDSGVDITHPDLVDNYDLHSHSYVYDYWINNLGNNQLSIDSSRDYHDDPIANEYGHGTPVAGAIGAKGNNNLGLTGVCWNVDIASLAIYNKIYRINTLLIVYAFIHATQRSIPIVNFSITFPYNTDQFYNMHQSMANYPGLIVCCAGNEGIDIDSPANSNQGIYPSVWSDLDNVITVGALTEQNVPRVNSNYGATSVDLFAPGEDILATDISSTGYGSHSGTSLAAPHVAGAAALLKSINPSLTTAQLKAAILDNVDYVPALIGKCVTEGKLNVYEAAMSVIPTLGNSSSRDVEYDNYNWEKVEISSPSTYTFTLAGNPGLELKLSPSVSSNMVPYDTSSIASGQTSTSITYLFPRSGTYFIRVYNPTSSDESYTLTKTFVSYHNHIYNGPLVSVDNDYHGHLCTCGEVVNLMPHVVKLNNPHLCIQCGAAIF